MMWSIGSKKSFTFVELMLTVAALSIGMVFLYRTYLSLLDNFNLCGSRIEANLFLQNKLWEAGEKLRQNDLSGGTTIGEFKGRKNKFEWKLDVLPVKGVENFCNINLNVIWKQAPREINLKYQTSLAH
ncbi:MAG: hypothetical protein KKC11_08740 [Candidatus Omnitrophica bacterium]|nr:hypothetical protein [Candidatus Omnitrophota bacterium]